MQSFSDPVTKQKDYIRIVDPLMNASLLGALGCSDVSFKPNISI
jgi:hypothetical protein